MTWREKISNEEPERVDNYEWGDMIGCPTDNRDYGLCIGSISSCELCTACWDREVPKSYLTEDNKVELPDLSEPGPVVNVAAAADKKREGSVEAETTADVIADMYHRLIDRGFPSGTAEIIVYKMIDHGYFDKK